MPNNQKNKNGLSLRSQEAGQIKTNLTNRLYQVTTTERLCAAFVVSNGKIVDCAPILRRRIDHWTKIAKKLMPQKGREILDLLMILKNDWATQCVYCNRDIVNTRLIPKEFKPKLIGGDKDKVDFIINGKKHRALRATADHYFERCYGGRSVLNNIIPACQPCNNMRSVGREWPICIDCLSYRTLYNKRCNNCHRAQMLRTADIARIERLCSEIINNLIQISTFSLVFV